MAEPGRTVRVIGLPTDMPDERLKDKLFIHFLRSSNGGGEIDSVIIVKATPVSALITFEDSRVAQRVIHLGRHVLEVDGKKYKLTAIDYCEGLSLDQIFLSLSATIDYSLIPGGITALKNICNDHPCVSIHITKNDGCCTLTGGYTEIQSLLAQLLERLGGSESAENQESSTPASKSARSLQTAQQIQEADGQRRKPDKQKEKKQTEKPPNEYIPGSVRDLTPGGYSWEDPGQTDGAAAQQFPSTSPEDFTLIVDADMFQYLQKRCQKEYQKILSQYDVEVVDMTNEGLTTLFLQVGAAEREGAHARECLALAREAIGRLYQENESKVRRAQLPKAILSSKGEVKRALESLSVSHPKLLLNEDNQNIYIIGSDRDVSEAKLCFLLDQGKVREKGEDEASDLRFPPYTSSSLTSADEERVRLLTYSPGGYSDERLNEMLKSKEDESRTEGARRFKLAPQFKDSGIGVLGTRLTDFTSRANSSTSGPARRGPMLGYDVLSDTAKLRSESITRAETQNTGEDILFNPRQALSSFPSRPNKSTFLKPELIDTEPKTSKSPLTTTQSSSLGSTTPLLPAVSGTTLKRANSFSGTAQKKAQVNDAMSQDDSSKPSVRARVRSSSFTAKAGREKQEVHTAELTVSPVLWSHIIDAYRTRVDDLTSDIQMKERSSESFGDLTLVLKGATSSKVSSCLLGLQELVDSVKSDFSVQELRLSELAITDTTDETLQACCCEVRSRFKKVSIQLLNDSLFLRGPAELCSRIGASVREVFSGAAKYPSSIPPTSQSTWSSRMNKDQSNDLQVNGTSPMTIEGQKVKTHGICSSQEWQTTYNSDFNEKDVVNRLTGQPLKRKDCVIKDKVKAVEVDGLNTEGVLNQSSAVKDTSVGRANGVGSPATCLEKEAIQKDSEGQEEAKTKSESLSKGSRSGQEASALQCHCGADGMPLIQTKCGLAMCSKCLDINHIQCKACPKTEQKLPGIYGTMKIAKLPLSLAGYTKNCTIKIKYEISDGIQEEGHPFPGKPFRGGVFEAFLPDCEKTMALLPRLEKAFRQGLTFTVTGGQTDAKVFWDCVPHKTSVQGGRSGNGYPDSGFLTRLSEVLTSHGI